jgi:transposase
VQILSADVRSLNDSRFEIDSNVVKRSVGPTALSRKNTLFADSDGADDHWQP